MENMNFYRLALLFVVMGAAQILLTGGIAITAAFLLACLLTGWVGWMLGRMRGR